MKMVENMMMKMKKGLGGLCLCFSSSSSVCVCVCVCGVLGETLREKRRREKKNMRKDCLFETTKRIMQLVYYCVFSWGC